jgi:hypothetical protein
MMICIPKIPLPSQLDDEWIDWAANTYGVSTNVVRGMLAGFYTMRARRYAKGIAHVRGEAVHMENARTSLSQFEAMYPQECAADRAMYSELIPQLQELAR